MSIKWTYYIVRFDKTMSGCKYNKFTAERMCRVSQSSNPFPIGKEISGGIGVLSL